MRMPRALSCLAAGLVSVAAAAAQPGNDAASYPERPIRMIVGWSAGGGTDIPARVVADHLSRRLKVPVIVENRVGASGMIASEYVAQAAPDGYTIQYTVADTHSVNPHLFPDIRYDAMRDFVPVAVVGYGPTVLIVNARMGIHTMDEFIAQARKNPGKMTFASWGMGSGGQVRMAAIMDEAGINLLHVPYKGSAPALEAVVAGHVDAMVVPATMAKPQAEVGKVRILAVDTPQRADIVPDVKTYSEQGYAYNLRFWQGILAPAGTPPAIVDKLNHAIDAALATPEAQADLKRVAITRLTPGDGSAEAARQYMRDEYERWGNVIRNAKITVK